MQCPIPKRTCTLSLLADLVDRGAQKRRRKQQGLTENEVDDHAVYRFLTMLPVDIKGCWEWKGSRRKKGLPYGKFTIFREDCQAHRFSYRLFCGAIPSGMRVLHRCDNPPCCNPDHLFLGTDKDNAVDRDRKGRHRTNPRRGERSPFAKLTEEQVRRIINLPAKSFSQREMGRQLGVAGETIRQIVLRNKWNHVQ